MNERKHPYLHICAPDAKAVIEFAATHDAAEVTIEITLDGDELHVYIKRGPDSVILLDDCYDVSHDENKIDFGPDSQDDFSSMLSDNEETATQDDYKHHYEHNQWWVVSTVSGETWSVHETLDDGVPSVGFELISEGVE